MLPNLKNRLEPNKGRSVIKAINTDKQNDLCIKGSMSFLKTRADI